jgi:hypothetical protein
MKKIVSFMFLAYLIIGCKKEENVIVKENPPSVLTKEASDITLKNATLNGEVTDEGITAATDRGFVISDKNINPSVSDTKVQSGYGKGIYSIVVDKLVANTKYYYKAYATNTKGTSYGETQSFSTADFKLASAVIEAPQNVTSTTVQLAGTISDDGGSGVTERGFCLSTSTLPTTSNIKIQNGNGLGTFSSVVTQLKEETIYFVRAYAINSKGTSYSSEISFKTLPGSTLKNELIAYYSFSGNALDQSGNGNHGKVLGSPQLTTDRYNNANSAYSFSTAKAGFGTLNQEINIPFNPAFNTKTITVAAWVNPITYGWSGNTPDYSVIISRFQDGYSNPNGQVWTLTCQTTKIESYILNASSANNQTNTLVASPTPIPLNKWSHVAITYDGNTLKLYINGDLVHSKTSGLVLNTLGSSGISIGESFNANGYWNPFNGKIDDVAIYGRALSETEMKSLFNSQGLY